MAVLPIVLADNPLLRQKTRKLRRTDASTERLIDDMIETMRAAPGVGLAANQVGVPLRLAVIEIPAEAPPAPPPGEASSAGEPPADRRRPEPVEGGGQEGKLYVLVNPEIVKREGEREVEEGCLSLPGYRAIIKRAERVTARARDRQGKPIRIKADGLLAQALEHETDHLDGILYFDHLDSLAKLYKIEPKNEPETGGSSEPVLATRGGGDAGGDR